MRVIWTPEAEQDRTDIWDHIAGDNPFAAAKMDELFGELAVRLATHPKLGQPGKITGTRELIPHESYRLLYEISGDTVWVLAFTLQGSGRPYGSEEAQPAAPLWMGGNPADAHSIAQKLQKLTTLRHQHNQWVRRKLGGRAEKGTGFPRARE